MKLTVGDVRKAIEGLPDDAPVLPHWTPGCIPMGDNDPSVSLDGFRKENGELWPMVSLEYWAEEDDD